MSYAIHTGGGSATPGQKVFRYKSPMTGDTTEFHAEQGLISIYGVGKDRQEEYFRVPIREFLLRARALADSARRPGKYPRERKAVLDLVDVMIRAAEAARDQGDPFNERALADMTNTRLPSRVAMGGHATIPASSYLPDLSNRGVGAAKPDPADAPRKILE